MRKTDQKLISDVTKQIKHDVRINNTIGILDLLYWLIEIKYNKKSPRQLLKKYLADARECGQSFN